MPESTAWGEIKSGQRLKATLPAWPGFIGPPSQVLQGYRELWTRAACCKQLCIGVAITITAEMSAALEDRAGSSLQENTGEVEAYLWGRSAKLGITLQSVGSLVGIVGRLDPVFKCFKSPFLLAPQGMMLSIATAGNVRSGLVWFGFSASGASEPLGEKTISLKGGNTF